MMSVIPIGNLAGGMDKGQKDETLIGQLLRPAQTQSIAPSELETKKMWEEGREKRYIRK